MSSFYQLLESESEFISENKPQQSLESFGHIFAKTLLRQWLIKEDEGCQVWLEYPLYERPGSPVDYRDEFCGPYLCATYRSREFSACACLECKSRKDLRYITDVAVGWKGQVRELWEVVNKSGLTANKLTYYQYLKYYYGIDFYCVPDMRILHKVNTPDLYELRRDHCG